MLQSDILSSHQQAVRWFFKYWSRRLSGRPIASLHRRQLLIVTFTQSLYDSFNRRQVASLARKDSSGPGIRTYCQKHGFKLDTVSVSAGAFPDALLHFIEPKDAAVSAKENATGLPRDGASRTVFYCHGGGYHNAILGDAQIPLALDITAASKAHSLVLLEYTLAPEQAYPCQLVQAVAALQYLLKEKRLRASDIVLAGDSAGAHLILALFAHIAKPAPFAPAIEFGEREPFCAAVLVSPWVSMRGEEASIRANDRDDYVTKEQLLEFVHYLRGDFDDVWFDVWENPAARTVWDRAFPHTFWKHKTVCSRVFVTIGTSEILLDSCLDFSTRLLKCKSVLVETEADVELVKAEKEQKSAPAALLAVVSGEVHAQPGLDNAVGYSEGLSRRTILRFLETRFSEDGTDTG